MMRASEPPMKLRLFAESVILLACAFTDFSHLEDFFVPILAGSSSTEIIDMRCWIACQQKMLIR
jgi:hypothetical protein